MPRLIETKEPRPEHSTVINWTVPVYIKNGEDYYKVCFDIKRKPLADGTLPLTDEELREFDKQYNVKRGWESIGVYLRKTSYGAHYLTRKYYDPNSFEGKRIEEVTFDYLEAILWLAERFNLTGEQ